MQSAWVQTDGGPGSDAISAQATAQRAAAAAIADARPLSYDPATLAANFGNTIARMGGGWQDISVANWPEARYSVRPRDGTGLAVGTVLYAIPGGTWAAGGGGSASLSDAQLRAAGGRPHTWTAPGQAASGWLFVGRDPLSIFGRPGDPGAQTHYFAGEDTDWTGYVVVATAAIGGALIGAYIGAGSSVVGPSLDPIIAAPVAADAPASLTVADLGMGESVVGPALDPITADLGESVVGPALEPITAAGPGLPGTLGQIAPLVKTAAGVVGAVGTAEQLLVRGAPARAAAPARATAQAPAGPPGLLSLVALAVFGVILV
jgi:hypothetical protein